MRHARRSPGARRVGVAALLALVAALPVGVRAEGCGTDALRALGEEEVTPRLRELTLQSSALAGQTKARVLLPAGYGSGGAFPVLLLLHGAGDDHTTWSTNTSLEEIAEDFDGLVVMPDAGRGPAAGWYSDWVDGPAWESYHVGELLPFLDACYPTARSTGGRPLRAVAGLSMGGFGAMSYAARHPDAFVASASFSGAVDSSNGGPAQAAAYELAHDRFGTPDDRVWGPYETSEVRWRDHNPPDLSPNLRGTALWLSTGNGVPAPDDRATDGPVESAVYAMNVSLHADLTAEGIGHEWRDRGYGTHAWRYWEADLAASLPYLDAAFEEAADDGARPDAFDYRRAEPSFSVWDYDFSVAGRAMEFLDLRDVSPSGLVARGSGLLSISTPPLYAPGATHAIVSTWESASGGVAARATFVAADADGRLRFAVDLGPPHTAQQYTVEGRTGEVAAGPDYYRTVRVTIGAVDDG